MPNIAGDSDPDSTRSVVTWMGDKGPERATTTPNPTTNIAANSPSPSFRLMNRLGFMIWLPGQQGRCVERQVPAVRYQVRRHRAWTASPGPGWRREIALRQPGRPHRLLSTGHLWLYPRFQPTSADSAA